jgi:dTMP kinase
MPYIVIEGMDGCGKSTQVQLLAKRLEEELGADKVMVTREPGGTPIAEAIRDILKGKLGPVTKESEILLMAASRAELKVQIEQALKEGKWVISDRNYVSSYAYQGFGHFMRDAVIAIHEELDLIIKPDYFFLLEVSDDVRNARITARDTTDPIEGRDYKYFERVAAGYQSTYVPTKIHESVIDADQSADKVHEDIWFWIDVLPRVEY